MKRRFNLQTRSIMTIAIVLFIALGLNTAVLTLVASDRYENAIHAKTIALGEGIQRDLGKALQLGLLLENIEGVNEKLKELISRDHDIAYALVFDAKGQLLYQGDGKGEAGDLRDMKTHQETSSQKVMIKRHGAYYDISLPLAGADGNLVGSLLIGVKVSAVRDEITKLIFWAAVVSVLIFLFSVGLTYISVSKFITKPIVLMEKVVGQIASGDLTQTIPTGSMKYEILNVVEAVNKMTVNLREIVNNVVNSSRHVSASAERVAHTSGQIAKSAQDEAAATEETTASMEEMASSISQVANNTEALATNVDETSATINEMAASIEQVGKSAGAMADSVSRTATTIEEMLASVEHTARNAQDMTSAVGDTTTTVEHMLSSIEKIAKNTDALKNMVIETSTTIEEMMRTVSEVAVSIEGANKVSQTASRKAEEGGKAIYQSIESLHNIGKTTEKTMTLIQNLGKRSEAIGSILEVINEIADQTNLLALNAAIEAARAGDTGRGFAVVAEEIRKLAERSMGATKEIAGVIRQVQDETETAIKATEETYREGKGGIALAGASKDAISEIRASIKESSDVMRAITQSASELNRAIGQVTKYIGEMNSSTEGVADAVKAQVDGAGSIRAALERMNSMAIEVHTATREQTAGGKQIGEVVNQMKNTVYEVSLAVQEQVSGTRQIVQTVENMHAMTQQVASATAEQKTGGDTIVKAMEGMSSISAENLKLSQEIVTVTAETLLQIKNLKESVSTFKIDSNGDNPMREEISAGV